jgi:NTE family protein
MSNISIASPLDSAMIGTSASDLIEGCRVQEPCPGRPEPVEVEPPLAVAFSGGGFRATLAAIGVGLFLADAGLLGRVRYFSSVSGGSVANGLVACAWEKLRARGFSSEAYERHVVHPLVDQISRRSLTATLVRNAWRTVGKKTRTDLLADFLDEWFFDQRRLEDLPGGIRFVFNAANISTGVRFGFERDVLGDWVIGRVATAGAGIRVAQAVAASAAVPGAFAPMRLDLPFPCAQGRTAMLVDGGAYDNLGLEVIDDLRDVCLVAINAGGVFQTGRWGWVPVARELKRASGLLYRQSSALRMRTMIERFRAWEFARDAGEPPPAWARQGVLFGLATTMGDSARREWLRDRPEPTRQEVVELALTPTSFGKFSRPLCERLIHRGWWLTGATLSRFHPSLLGSLPQRRPLS